MQFTSVVVDWYQSTFIFYVSIMLCIYFVSLVIRNKRIKVFKHISITIWAAFFFLITSFVMCFRTTGRDLRHGYMQNFFSATSMQNFRDKSLEIGFRVLNIIIRRFTDNYQVLIIIVGILTIIPIYIMISKYKKKIDVPTALIMYMSIFFVNSFSPLRMALAASISLFAFDAMIEKKSIKALIWIVVAACFHITALALVIPYFITFSKVFDRKLIVLSSAVFFAVIALGRNSLTSFFASSDRYYNYASFNTIHIGFEQIVYYAPFFYLFIKTRRRIEDKSFSSVSFTYLVVGFVFGMLGYIVSVFGRFSTMFLQIIIIIPYFVKIFKDKYPHRRIWINLVIIIYCLARFYIFISQYYILEELMPYTNSFGWVI